MIRVIFAAVLVIILSASAYAVLPYGMEVQVDVGMPGAISTDEFPSSYGWEGSHILGGGILVPLIEKRNSSNFALSARLHGSYYRFKRKFDSAPTGYSDMAPTRIVENPMWYAGVFGGLQLGFPALAKYVTPYAVASLGFLHWHAGGSDYFDYQGDPESGCGAEADLGVSVALARHQSLYVEGLAVADLYSHTAAHFWGVRMGIGIH